jgi:hypothetical protein
MVAALLGAAPAWAQTAGQRAEARAHFDRGLALAKGHDYEAALREFQQAHAILPHYSVLYNIAQAQLAAGHRAEARESFQRYLSDGGSAVETSRRAEVESLIAELDDTGGAPAAAEGFVSGAAPPAVGTGSPAAARSASPDPAPAPAPAPPAPSAPNGAPPRAAPAPLRPVLPTSPTPVAGASAPALMLDQAGGLALEQPQDSGATRRTLAYVLGGVSAVLAGATLGHYLWNRSRYEDWEAQRGDYERDPREAQRRTTNELAESISSASVVTVALGVGASVALGTGVVLLVSGSPGGSRASGPNAAASVQGTF